MKRKRYEMEKKKTELQTAIEELSLLIITKPVDNIETSHIPLTPFLSFCYLIIQVLGILFYFLGEYFFINCFSFKVPKRIWIDYNVHIEHNTMIVLRCFVLVFADKIGPTMAVLRQDIDQNIQVTKDNVTSILHAYKNKTFTLF